MCFMERNFVFIIFTSKSIYPFFKKKYCECHPLLHSLCISLINFRNHQNRRLTSPSVKKKKKTLRLFSSLTKVKIPKPWMEQASPCGLEATSVRNVVLRSMAFSGGGVYFLSSEALVKFQFK